MKLNIVWHKPLQLSKARNNEAIYSIDPEKIPEVPGIYIFARHYGKSFEALYVGKSGNMRHRVRGHLNNLKLMKFLENSKTGKRVLIAGQAITRPGQQIKTVLPALERAFIRHFLAEGHDLVNKQGVRIRKHEISSDGHFRKSFIPSLMFLERGKGE